MWSQSQNLWWALLQMTPQGDNKSIAKDLSLVYGAHSIHGFCKGFYFSENYEEKSMCDSWQFYGICSSLMTLKRFTHKSAVICLLYFLNKRIVFVSTCINIMELSRCSNIYQVCKNNQCTPTSNSERQYSEKITLNEPWAITKIKQARINLIF